MIRSFLSFLLAVLIIDSSLHAAHEPGWGFDANVGYAAGNTVNSVLNSFDEYRGGVMPKRHHLSFGFGSSYAAQKMYVRDGSRIKVRQAALVPVVAYSFNLERWKFGFGAMVPTVITSSSLEQLNKVSSALIDNLSIRYTVPGARKFSIALNGSLAATYAELVTYAQWPLLQRAQHQLFYDMSWGVRSLLFRQNVLLNSLVTAHGVRYQCGMFGAQVMYDANFGVARSLLDRANVGIASHMVSAGVSAAWKELTAHLRGSYAIAQSWLLRAASPFGISVGLQYVF